MTEPCAQKRIAILGGGPAGLTAAFYLTDPSLAGQYDVTVYQYGWRLGGKGACARNPAQGQRVEEHGLHEFLGFYDNAFRMIREMWPQWKAAPNTRFPTWNRAFEKQETITFMQQVELDGEMKWEPWSLKPPCWPGVPGDEDEVDIDDFLPRLLKLLVHGHQQAGIHAKVPHAHIATRVAHLLSKIPHPHPGKRGPLFLGLIRRLLLWAFPHILPHTLQEDMHRAGLLIRLAYAAGKGLIEDVLPYGVEGFDRINDIEFRNWLMLHGASHDDAWSAPVKSLYDAAFAYKTGDATKPEQNAQLAAGVALHAGLLMFLGSRGSFLWKMNAGMGDTIFSPMYDVLRDRGVKFEFFHRVENIGLSEDRKRVERIEIMRQADLKMPYQPFVWVKQLPCWPDEPHWEFIERGDEIRRELAEQHLTLESWWCTKSWAKHPNVTLEHGRDFDEVICAISLAALPPITRELSEASEAWKSMLANIPTIRTQGVQLWLKPTLKDLGWKVGPTVSVSYTEPFDSWGEMSHLLPVEDWSSSPVEPQSVEYFCGALSEDPPDAPRSDTTFPRRMTELVKQNAHTWLSNNIAPLWPLGAQANSSSLNFELLLDGFDHQYFRANIDPSERYVLSVPGSMQYRLHTDGSGFENLWLAGDWIVTRVNSGAFEAAVEAGCRCSHAMAGVPAKVFGLHDY